MNNHLVKKDLLIYVSIVFIIGIILLLSSNLSSFAFSKYQGYNENNSDQKYKKNVDGVNLGTIECHNNNININNKKITDYVQNEEIPPTKESLENSESTNVFNDWNTHVNICLNINVNKEVDKSSKLKENSFVKDMNIAEKKDDIYYNYYDEYVSQYEKDYFKKNQLKINEINKKVMENNKKIEKQDFEKSLTSDFAGRELTKLNIAFILPTFTMAAYDDYNHHSFYSFYKKYAGISENEIITTDLDLLTANVPNITESFLNARADGLKILADRISSTSNDIDITFFTDQDVHNGLIFDKNQNNYDILILGHQEYVTQEEYNNFKEFVKNGGILILFSSNVFYTEVMYDPIADQVTLVEGHSWAFDGDKAWRSVLERWMIETREWVGSNFFNCGQGCHIDFKNNPFSYIQHEEQYITNPDVKILLDYEAQSIYNILVAAYELDYGKGKVISFGIFGDDIKHNKEFLRFFDQMFFSTVSFA